MFFSGGSCSRQFVHDWQRRCSGWLVCCCSFVASTVHLIQPFPTCEPVCVCKGTPFGRPPRATRPRQWCWRVSPFDLWPFSSDRCVLVFACVVVRGVLRGYVVFYMFVAGKLRLDLCIWLALMCSVVLALIYSLHGTWVRSLLSDRGRSICPSASLCPFKCGACVCRPVLGCLCRWPFLSMLEASAHAAHGTSSWASKPRGTCACRSVGRASAPCSRGVLVQPPRWPLIHWLRWQRWCQTRLWTLLG